MKLNLGLVKFSGTVINLGDFFGNLAERGPGRGMCTVDAAPGWAWTLGWCWLGKVGLN